MAPAQALTKTTSRSPTTKADNEWGYSHRLADLTGLVASTL
jgi:hypothetical protein